MHGLFEQIALLVAMTHGLRALARIAGPRRCGLILGLPGSTSLMLLYCGLEDGVGEAMAWAEASLLGLVAAAILPLAYARAIRLAPWPPLAPAAAVAAYVAVVAVFRFLPDAGAAARIGLSNAGVLVACSLASRVRIASGEPRPGPGPWLRHLALRTMVPAALLVTVRVVRTVGGASWAGLFTTFPAMSLALLVATHLEAGPAAVCRMARAMPPGNLITLIFLAAFRLAGDRIGLGWGAVCGYAGAVATMLALERLGRSSTTDPHPGVRTTSGLGVAETKGAVAPAVTPTILDRRPGGPGPIARRRPRCERRFAPRIEVISGRGLLDSTTGAIAAIGPTLCGSTLVRLDGPGLAVNGQLSGLGPGENLYPVNPATAKNFHRMNLNGHNGETLIRAEGGDD